MPQSKVDGDALIISVPTEDVRSVLSANGYEFGGINIKIEMVGRPTRSGPEFTFGKRDTSLLDTNPGIKENILAAIGRRYNKETKVLDLSNIGQDPDFNKAGFFGLGESGDSKFFDCIMKVCNEFLKTREVKETAIAGVSVANNGFKEITPVATLAFTFPDIQAIDLSGNRISSMEDLSRWKYKFKKLAHIVLTGNPIEEKDSTLVRSLKLQFLALATVDNLPIPAEAMIKPTPPKVLPGIFNDTAGIGKQFLTTFYPGFDNERAAMVPFYYDADSKFSYSINMKGLRDQSEPKVLQKGEWSAYTRNSRNLTILNNPHAKIERLHRGVVDITKAFSEFPATRHPELGSDNWLFECSTLPFIPDLAGTPGGVNGLRICVHGQYQEIESGKNRSFDRTFILGPGPNGVRIVNDIMIIRGYGGSAAFQAEAPEPEIQPQVVEQAPAPTEEEQKKLWVIQLASMTGMNLQYSELCLNDSGWVPDEALANFNRSKEAGRLPAEAFVQ